MNGDPSEKMISMYKAVFLVAVLVFLLIISGACNTRSEAIPASGVPTGTGVGNEFEWIRVYFSDPEASYATSYRGGLDTLIVEVIDTARASVDIAIYNLNLWSIKNALLDAHARGVVVRIVTDSDTSGGIEFQDLIRAGIPVLGDRHESLMHNKFLIIDRRELWTGSMNFTLNGFYEDNNNLITTTSLDIVENYLVEFNEMFVDDSFGNESPSNTPHPVSTIDDITIETLFSPEDGVEERLVALIESAQVSIQFMAYSFTSDPLGKAIRLRAKNGVNVIGILDEDQAKTNEGGEYDPFLQAGLNIKLDGNTGQMHFKTIIIDEKVVITGSYNFSRNAAEFNDENVLIIHDPVIAEIFVDEFWKVFKRAKAP